MIKYLSYWQSVDPLTLLEVGFLWAGYEPPPDEELIERPATQMQSMVAIPSNLFKPKPLPQNVRRSFEIIIKAMRGGLLPEPQPSWINLDVLSPKNINNFALISITRTNLRTLSKQLLKMGYIYTVPAFLVVLDEPEPCKNDPVVDQGAIADAGPVDTEKDKSRAFVLSQKNVINNIYDLIRLYSKEIALEKVAGYLIQNPCEHLKIEYLTKDDFSGDDPLRDYKGCVAQAMLRHSRFKKLGLTEIKSILPEKKRTKK